MLFDLARSLSTGRRKTMAECAKPTEGELILYHTQEGTVRVEVLYEAETFWLDQNCIAELFGVDIRTGKLPPGRDLRLRRVKPGGNSPKNSESSKGGQGRHQPQHGLKSSRGGAETRRGKPVFSVQPGTQ